MVSRLARGSLPLPQHGRHPLVNDPTPESNCLLLQTAPVKWALTTDTDGKTLVVDDEFCTVGLQDGRVVDIDQSGVVSKVYQLPHPVAKVMRDNGVLYAWCYSRNAFSPFKGALYEFSSGSPRLQFDLERFGDRIVYADMAEGLLAVGDDKGNVAVLGANGKILWTSVGNEGSSSLFCMDKEAVYVGHKRAIKAYNVRNGNVLWTHSLTGRMVAVQTGTQDALHVYAEIGAKVLQIAKKGGDLLGEFCPDRHRCSGIALNENLLVTGTCPTVLFDLKTRQEVYRMNYAGRLNESDSVLLPSGKMFTMWDKVYCVDLTPTSIQRAVEGKSTCTKEVFLKEGIDARVKDHLDDDCDLDLTIKIKCVQLSNQLKARVLSEGYREDYHVCLPKSLLQAGKVYVVEGVRKSEVGEFYRVVGKIRTPPKDEPSKSPTRDSPQKSKVDADTPAPVKDSSPTLNGSPSK